MPRETTEDCACPVHIQGGTDLRRVCPRLRRRLQTLLSNPSFVALSSESQMIWEAIYLRCLPDTSDQAYDTMLSAFSDSESIL
jgi:hypothetical protein